MKLANEEIFQIPDLYRQHCVYFAEFIAYFSCIEPKQKKYISYTLFFLPLDGHAALCIAKIRFCSCLFPAVIQFLEIIPRYVKNNLELATGMPEENFHLTFTGPCIIVITEE